ncbi:MAG TPA: UbiA family prenyltransferase [Tepidisphaeraceae bacterium]|jgi:4-hydroxybenzoate polyprenyltransferase|nr:UbiA family prenyltransferase [Tepidisphaeraceae bacterium]
MTTSTETARPPFLSRWWTYQRERFPIFAHGLLIAAFSSSAVSYSALLRGQAPRLVSIGVAFVTCFLLFLQLRIADEFKDFDEDSRYRPYRPVPRGLIRLRELGMVFVIGAIIQLLLALALNWKLLLVLAGVWVYLALMSREFFVRDWLKARPFTYMWTHMLIMPQIDFYATATDWIGTGSGPPRGVMLFLWVSFFNGMVIEIGRKIRAPQDEEEGVDTYSRVWGRRGAVTAWLAAIALTAAFALMAAWRIHSLLFAASFLSILALAAVTMAVRYLSAPSTPRAKAIETMSGIWTLMMYLNLGLIPLAVWYFFRRA